MDTEIQERPYTFKTSRNPVPQTSMGKKAKTKVRLITVIRNKHRDMCDTLVK